MLTVGAAAVDITPPIGTPLDGYSGRADVSLGIHDPLYARALYLHDGSTALAIVACDLIGVGRALTARARELLAERPGIAPGHVTIAATHTHAGPAGVRGAGDPTIIESTARKIAGAVRLAHRNATEAALKYGATELTSIAQNRRQPDWPIDRRLDVLAADTPTARNLATVARYSCHPTTMERDNLEISADYPGEACRAIETLIGGDAVALYLNGCCGNINPAWIRQEFDDVRRLGTIVGGKAASLSQELRPLGVNNQAHNIRWSELTEKPVTEGIPVAEAPLAAVTRTVPMPYRTGPDDETMTRLVARLRNEVAQAPDAATRREAAARLTRAQGEQLALQRVASRGPTRDQELQALRLGESLYFLALPGEVFIETQEEIREASGMPNLLVISYANDYPGYFCRPEAYDQGGYEAGVTPFAPEADRLLVQHSLELLEEVR